MVPISQSDPKATYKCKVCGAFHGGAAGASVCPECAKKGLG